MKGDNKRYYSIVKVPDEGYRVEGSNLFFDDPTTMTNLEQITNDREFRNTLHHPGLYWSSGGGTFLLNGKYIFIVRRHRDALTNAYKVSLFTGRADSLVELHTPTLLVRELFEELILFKGDTPIYPVNRRYQSVIDEVYESHAKSRDDFDLEKVVVTDISEIKTSDKSVFIGPNQHNVDFHINSSSDVNILFLFSISLDLHGANLRFVDGENYMKGDELHFPDRDIFLLDLDTMEYEDNSGSVVTLTTENMTEHLSYFITKIKEAVRL